MWVRSPPPAPSPDITSAENREGSRIPRHFRTYPVQHRLNMAPAQRVLGVRISIIAANEHRHALEYLELPRLFPSKVVNAWQNIGRRLLSADEPGHSQKFQI
ncbi:MAG: hypothetical protein ACRD2N_20275 [Vicinamibacterales bacterium]